MSNSWINGWILALFSAGCLGDTVLEPEQSEELTTSSAHDVTELERKEREHRDTVLEPEQSEELTTSSAHDVTELERKEREHRARDLEAQARASGERRQEGASAIAAVIGEPIRVPNEAAQILGSAEYTAEQVRAALSGFAELSDPDPPSPGDPHAPMSPANNSAETNPADALPEPGQGDGAPIQISASTPSPTFQFTAGNTTDRINIGGHPADANVSAGRSHVCVTARAALACYSKGGRLVLAPTLADDFFSRFGFTGIYDLRTAYDHFRDRFWIVGLTNWGSVSEDKIVIAVSKTPDPRDGWHQYWTNAYGPLAASGNQADYPLIGIDNTAVYITNKASYSDNGEPKTYWHVVLYRASDMTAGKPGSQVQGWRFWNLLRPDGSILSNVFTPANHHTFTSRGFFLSRRGSRTVDIYALNNPLSSSQSWTVKSVNLANFGSPNKAEQRKASGQSSAPLVKFDNLGTAALNAHYRGGSLVFACNDERNWDAQGNRPSVRLVKLNVSDLNSIGVDIDRTFGARRAGESDYFAYGWAGVSINKNNEIALAYARTGKAIYPQVRVSAWLPGDLDIRSSVLATAGFTTFLPPSGIADVWYDAASASVDPVNDTGIYFAQQYPSTASGSTTNNFRIRVIKMFGDRRPDVLPIRISRNTGSVPRGGSFTVTLDVANDGDDTMPAFTNDLRLSSNDYISSYDTQCATFSQSSLAYGATPRTVSVTCTVPTTLAIGPYYVGARLDTGSAATETDEDNNANPSFVTLPTIQVY